MPRFIRAAGALVCLSALLCQCSQDAPSWSNVDTMAGEAEADSAAAFFLPGDDGGTGQGIPTTEPADADGPGDGIVFVESPLLHSDQVDDAVEVAFAADRVLERNAAILELVVDFAEHTLERGADAVDLVDDR